VRRFFVFLKSLSLIMNVIATFALASIVCLTVLDVILRRFRMPIDFTYEVVTLLGPTAIGFSLPLTTLNKSHVLMDFLTDRLSQEWQRIFSVITRFLGIGIFAILGWRIFCLGTGLWDSGEVTPILQIPTYPIAYGLGACCFIQCLVLFYQLLGRLREAKA
jgi:TRAP-type C4-dicarboxylate transport system permease small subunit